MPQINHGMSILPEMCTKYIISPGDDSFWEYQGGLLGGGDTFSGFFSSSSCRCDG